MFRHRMILVQIGLFIQNLRQKNPQLEYWQSIYLQLKMMPQLPNRLIDQIRLFELVQNCLQLVCFMQQQKIAALREWMTAKGCRIHPHLTIPSNLNGVQGVSTNKAIPAKTLIVAVPSNLILTVSRCYNDPVLKKLFLGNDDLFDYEASEDAQFNVLCVFIMYHKLNLETSEWKAYLETIAEPETAVDWPDADLKGLNRSLIEEVIHVRIECQKLQNELVAYLLKRKQFQHFGETTLRKMFNYCYRAVMTRCFGYYFNEACLIPIADLINHGCQAIDHQLINVNFESGKDFHQAYYNRKDRINCELLSIQGPKKRNLPFRQKFLVENGIYQDNDQKLAELDRRKIQNLLFDWNKNRLNEGQKLQNLQFCSEDEQQDNDTDEEFQVEQIRELDHCKKTEQLQMKDFMTHFVTVERYVDVEKKLQQLQGTQESQAKKQEDSDNVTKKQEPKSQESTAKEQQAIKECQSINKQAQQLKQRPQIQQKQQKIIEKVQPTSTQPQQKTQQTHTNPFSNSNGRGVPIQMVDSSSQQDEDEQQWGLQDGSYFTMATSSPVAPNREIYNSYGSRTNKFLLIWYGFTYPDNLYDSVSFRLQVQFGVLRPASQVVLDSYIGGQGLSFKKPNLQVVKQTEISRQFRLKRSNICQNLLFFLRLYLMNYYKGEDLYKLFVTFPSSCEFQLFVFRYYRDIVESLYERYPVEAIEILKEQMNQPQYQESKFKIRYKVIYLEEQRKLLDLNLKAVHQIIDILEKVKKNGNVLERNMYMSLPIEDLRIIRKYLVLFEKHNEYVLYSQKQGQSQQIQQSEQKVEQVKEQQQWQSQSDDQPEQNPSKIDNKQ